MPHNPHSQPCPLSAVCATPLRYLCGLLTVLLTALLFVLPLCAQAEMTNALAESPRNDRFIITLAGDCTLGSRDQRKFASSSFVEVVREKGFDWPFSGVAHVFANDDLTLVNLEGTFTNYRRAAKKTYTFRAPPAYADILTLGSVEAVNLANNHSMDFGAQGFADTKQALDERGIAYCAPNEPVVVQIKGLRIALLGASFPLTDKKMDPLCAQVAAFYARMDIDLIIVSFHWGIERNYKQNRSQVNNARKVLDLGADVVVGTHPHVLQGIEMYNGKPIFYSLGNFSFGGNRKPNDYDTAMVQLEYDIREMAPRLVRLEIIPCRISEVVQGTQDFRPVIVSDEKSVRRIMKRLSYNAKGLPEDFFETGLWVMDGRWANE